MCPSRNLERTKRAEQGTIKVKITGGGQKCPKQWKKFLSDGENKTQLAGYLLKEWSIDSYASRIGTRKIFFALGSNCYRLLVISGKVLCEEVEELQSSHEEADTKILLHAKHAAESGERVVIIKSPDTDVFILACHLQNQIPAKLLFMKKARTRTIFLDIPNVVDRAGPELCHALPGLHAFTGCDSTSSFNGKGKPPSLKLCRDDSAACQAMSVLGRKFESEATSFLACEKFVCRLYGCRDVDDVNECRYRIFCTKNSPTNTLPPCQDALHKHTMRANYQAAIWCRALEPRPELPSPIHHGWGRTADGIKVDWMSLPSAPKALLELIICGCTGNCTTGHCSCKQNAISCTEACHYGSSCENPHNVWEDPDDIDEDHDD